MITKLGLAQIVITRLFPKPTQDKKLTEPQAMLLIDHARDYLAKREILQNRLEQKSIYGSWLSVYTGVGVKEDEACRKYITLPARPIALLKDFGIYHVWQGYDDTNLILPTMAGDSWLASNFSGYAGQPTYFLEQNKLILKGIETDTKINLRMLAMSEDIGAEDYYPFDGSMQGELIDIAVQRYAPTKGIPEDNLNDNNSQ